MLLSNVIVKDLMFNLVPIIPFIDEKKQFTLSDVVVVLKRDGRHGRFEPLDSILRFYSSNNCKSRFKKPRNPN